MQQKERIGLKRLFTYDSPLMRVLTFVADIFLTNLVFLVCCIPVITIGPAQLGLYTAMRVLADPEDDSSCLKAFFRGLRNGFGTICAAWMVMLVFDTIAGYTFLMAYSYQESGLFIHWVFPLAALAVFLILHSLLPLFFSQFGCGFLHLLRNCWIVMISHPLRTILTASLTWAPLVLFLLVPGFFVRISPLFFTVYYSGSFFVAAVAMKKPFQALIDRVCQ